MGKRVIFALLFLAGGSHADGCKDEWICVNAIQQGSALELHAKNLRGYPVTYTVRVQTDETSSDSAKVITRTLAPLSSEAALTLDLGGARSTEVDVSWDWTIGDKDARHNDDVLYSLPYQTGRSYRVLQGYGSRFSHTGLEQFAVDFQMPVGTPVHAARSGVVARVVESNNKGCWDRGCGRYANFIVILHDDGTTGEYYHLEKDGAAVTVGEDVKAGQLIGYSGNTGYSTMPHLHFAVYRASDWGSTQSIPIRFKSAHGIISKPRRGGRYEAK